MAKYLGERLLIAIPTLLGAVTLAFLMLRVLPGDVTDILLAEGAGDLPSLSLSREMLQRELGLNHPIYIQYFYWIWDFMRGDLGNSLYTGQPVVKELLNRLPLTLQLAVMAELFSLLIGIPVGILSAVRQDTGLDRFLRFWSIFFLAVPTFWLGLLVVLVGALSFDWIPPLGYNLLWKDPAKNLTQFVWPALILASHESARVSRMTRSSMLEVMREDYIRTARAKGLQEHTVLIGHALKNAMIPIVTYTSIYFGVLLGGVVVMERIFSIPGLGSLFLDSILFRDYTVIQALVFFLAVGFILINLTVDILYGWLDPRISLSKPKNST